MDQHERRYLATIDAAIRFAEATASAATSRQRRTEASERAAELRRQRTRHIAELAR